MGLDKITAKRAIRYLKRGVFPPDAIEYFTAGRERETRYIADALSEVQQGSSKHCFVEATYGFGKSHMLKIAESLALERGFAVAWVTINDSEHAFNHPTRYLHSLLENLRAPRIAARGLVELCNHWLTNHERDSLLNWASKHAPWEFRWPIERLHKAGSDDDGGSADWYLSILEGRDLQHKSGCVYFPDFYRRLEATVSMCRAVGCNGVLFLFDEIECIATHMNNIRRRLLSYQVLNTLADSRRFPHSMFLFAATEDLGIKISNDAFYYSEYEATYADGYRFAKKWNARELHIFSIKAITKEDNGKLLRRLRDAHGIAYSWQPELRIVDDFIDYYIATATRSGNSQREMVRWFIEILEISHQHSNFVPESQLYESSEGLQIPPALRMKLKTSAAATQTGSSLSTLPTS